MSGRWPRVETAMHDCNHYQTLLLEHLYGLLDDADNQALLDHLGSCGACQAALDKARHQQSLLATAAKEAFPSVRFEPPAEEAPAEVIPLPQLAERKPTARRWVRWAAAAAVLLAIGGVAVPAACWMKESDGGWWYLYLVTPLVGKDGGTRRAYRRLQEALQTLPHNLVARDPFRIKVVGPTEPVGQALLELQRRSAGRLPSWYDGSNLGGVSIDLAYLYPAVTTAADRN